MYHHSVVLFLTTNITANQERSTPKYDVIHSLVVLFFPLSCSFLNFFLGVLFLHKIPLCQFSKIMKDSPGKHLVKILDKVSGKCKKSNFNIETLNSLKHLIQPHNFLKYIRGKRGQLQIQTFKTPSFGTLSTSIFYSHNF